MLHVANYYIHAKRIWAWSATNLALIAASCLRELEVHLRGRARAADGGPYGIDDGEAKQGGTEHEQGKARQGKSMTR